MATVAMWRYAVALVAASPLGVLPASAAGDAVRGAAVFRMCMACHSMTPGEHMTGPSLARIWQRRAGSVHGFSRYSEAMQRADVVWTDATLDKWLANPAAFLPGTSMTFAGLRDSRGREDVIAYLKAVSEGKEVRSEEGAGMMMSMRPARTDLKGAPPEAQVTAITYCGDTYAVKTADGKVNKVWEFNLRFKTDSSRSGPLPGKPVIVGAGMQGDRASVVFAASSEISAFIKQDCTAQ